MRLTSEFQGAWWLRFVEARGAGILAPFVLARAADDDVPEIEQALLRHQLDEAQALVMHFHAPGAGEIVDGDAGRDRALPVGHLADGLQGLDPEAGAILEGAAIAVLAPVEMARQGMGGKDAGGAMDIEDVEAGIDGAPGRIGIHLHDAADVFFARRIGVDLGDAAGGEAVEGRRHIAALEIVLHPAGAQLDPRQRAPFMALVRHMAMGDDIALVPEGGADRGRLIDLGMDRAGFGAERRPAALGLDRAMGGIGPGLQRAGPGALRHLVEAVLQRLGPDPDRLEQDVVAWIARHLTGSPRKIRRRCGWPRRCRSSRRPRR